MQRLRLIKGQSYFINGHPHFYQGQENDIYRFLRWDGNQIYLLKNNLEKVKPAPQNEDCEQKLKVAKEEAEYYRNKYQWHEKKQEQEKRQKKYEETKNNGWFSDNKYVQVSALLTIILVGIGGIKTAIDSQTFWSGVLVFVFLLLGGIIISLVIAWGAYKIIGLETKDKNKFDIIVPLLFYLPTSWYVLYKIFNFLLSKHDTN
jgi:cation transport ATPase